MIANGKPSLPPPPQKKAKKAMGKTTGGVKINEPAPKPSSAPTPDKCSRSKFTMH
jgi:hypothetical protein